MAIFLIPSPSCKFKRLLSSKSNKYNKNYNVEIESTGIFQIKVD